MLLCTAMPFGYGPAAKVLVLASVLKDRGFRLVFSGRGIALELASRAAHLFDDILAHGPEGPSPAIVRSASAVLSVMDRESAQAALDASVPLYVVDSLLWMRDSIPSALRGARRYWAQNFLGFDGTLAGYHPRLSIVGPIIAPLPLRHRTAAEHLLINLGGCESPTGVDANARAYASFIVAGLRKSSLLRQFAGRTTLIAGRSCIESLRATSAGGDGALDLVSVSHANAIERLAEASLVLTAPGLTMTLESFQTGVPTYFLPPQNYSQWCVLRLLRGEGLAPHALHWDELPDTPYLRDRMPETERNPLVRAAIGHHTGADEARSRLTQRMNDIAQANHAATAETQTRFFESLGPNGAFTIAADIGDDMKSADVGSGAGWRRGISTATLTN